jgi:hypothetical protein
MQAATPAELSGGFKRRSESVLLRVPICVYVYIHTYLVFLGFDANVCRPNIMVMINTQSAYSVIILKSCMPPVGPHTSSACVTSPPANVYGNNQA